MDLLNLTNEKLLDSRNCICGSEEGVLFDGDLEDLLSDFGVSIGDFYLKKEVEYGDIHSEITNFERGELMGFVRLTQGDVSLIVPVVAEKYASDQVDEYLDFRTTMPM